MACVSSCSRIKSSVHTKPKNPSPGNKFIPPTHTSSKVVFRISLMVTLRRDDKTKLPYVVSLLTGDGNSEGGYIPSRRVFVCRVFKM